MGGELGGPCHALLPADGNGIKLLLQEVSDAKAGQNRMHFDLRVVDLHAAVARLLELGASQVTNEPLPNNGWVWHVLQDPDGDELLLCWATIRSTTSI